MSICVELLARLGTRTQSSSSSCDLQRLRIRDGPRAMFLRWVGLSMRATARVVPNGTLSKRTAVYLNEQTYLVVEREIREAVDVRSMVRDGTTCYLRAQL
jgi:hypothetical protein